MDSDRYFGTRMSSSAAARLHRTDAGDGHRPRPHNARPRLPLAEDLRRELTEHFAPYDAALAEWLGWAPSWTERADAAP